MATWDEILQVGSFGGVPFDFVSVQDDGSNELDVRRFPGRPGQSIDPRGRNGTHIEVVAVFIEDDYPDRMNALMAMLDDGGVVKVLVHPVFGAIRAACSRFSVIHDVEEAADSAMIRISFEEHTDIAGPIRVVNTLPSRANAVRTLAGSVQTALDLFAVATDLATTDPVYLGVQAAATASSSVADTLEATADTMSTSEIQATTNVALSEADEAIASVADYESTEQYDLGAALQAMSAALTAMAKDLLEARPPLTIYTVPAATNLLALVFDLYRDPTRVDELLGMNSFPDPLDIPAGTQVQAYAE